MEYPKYQTEFANSLPQIGIECPKCQRGIVEGSNFTSKKGEDWESTKCKVCLWQWIKSKPKPQKVEYQTTPDEHKNNEWKQGTNIAGAVIAEDLEGKLNDILEIVKNIECKLVGDKVEPSN